MCIFSINLHITAQCGLVMLLNTNIISHILCYSHWSSRGGINDNLLRKPLDQTRQMGHNSLYDCLNSERLALPFLVLF